MFTENCSGVGEGQRVVSKVNGQDFNFEEFEQFSKPEIDMYIVKAKHNAGASVREIADELGVSYSTIWHRLDRLPNLADFVIHDHYVCVGTGEFVRKTHIMKAIYDGSYFEMMDDGWPQWFEVFEDYEPAYEPTVNLWAYRNLREAGYTRNSILYACGWTLEELRYHRENWDDDSTCEVATNTDLSELRFFDEFVAWVDAREVVEKFLHGVSFKRLCWEWDVSQEDMWMRIGDYMHGLDPETCIAIFDQMDEFFMDHELDEDGRSAMFEYTTPIANRVITWMDDNNIN